VERVVLGGPLRTRRILKTKELSAPGSPLSAVNIPTLWKEVFQPKQFRGSGKESDYLA
jgi:hypothetical protein